MPASQLPFTDRTLRRLAALAIDLETLSERYLIKTKGGNIRNPDAYLLAMGQEEAARAAGVSIETIKRMNSGPEAVKAVFGRSAARSQSLAPSKTHCDDDEAYKASRH
jgi:hypothetical protein